MRAIDIAIREIGVREATGSNDGIPAERYMRGDALAWCAGFVLFCNEHADDDAPLARSTKEYYRLRSVSALMEEAKRRRWWFPRGEKTPEANDLVIFGEVDSDVGVIGNHIGIVEKATASMVHTVEGNTSNMVARREYPLGSRSILGFVRIPARTRAAS
jgi:hypothetical protein